MLKAITGFISALSPLQLAVFLPLAVAVVGTIDFATGYELSVSVFYTIPIGIGAWYSGRRLGFFLCVISALTWLLVDVMSGHHYGHPLIPLWNAGVRLSFFAIITDLLDRQRRFLALHVSLAQQDGLTGIMNARTFRQRCDSLFELASRHGRTLALGYLDLDGFKGVNDRLGHSVGDQVLKTVASTLSKRLRASDFCGRLGGDEFAVVLPETDLAGATTFFAALRENLIDHAALNGWPVGFSIGVAVFRSPPANVDNAIRCAETLMYKVKNSTKNNILLEEYTGTPRGALPTAASVTPAKGD
jgi:diguanylate cyclase (GGDEF)-like protein